MRRWINFLLVLLTVGCASTTTPTPDIPANQYGLRVITDAATYESLARKDPDQRLVDIVDVIPSIFLDIRYATDNNFMGEALYPFPAAYLRQPAAIALRGVQNALAREGLGLKVFDAYRPYSVTERMWASIGNPDYVADPAKGSRHNRGAAVDVTIIERHTGRELEMPTLYDDFTVRARHDFKALSPQILENRSKLRFLMERHGFRAMPSEWWHYDFVAWEKFPLMDVKFEDLEK